MGVLNLNERTPVLMDVPQKWGILPTRWFWEDPTFSRRLKAMVNTVTGVQTAAFIYVVYFAGLHLGEWRSACILGFVLFVSLQYGLAERFLRKAILARRAKYEALATAIFELPSAAEGQSSPTKAVNSST